MSIIIAENTTAGEPIFAVPEMEEAERATDTKQFQDKLGDDEFTIKEFDDPEEVVSEYGLEPDESQKDYFFVKSVFEYAGMEMPYSYF